MSDYYEFGDWLRGNEFRHYKTDMNKTTEALELLIDATSLSDVLQQLSEICFEKADHISASYDDQALARKWQSASNRLCVIATKSWVEAVSPRNN
jgi:hypothetical protein